MRARPGKRVGDVRVAPSRRPCAPSAITWPWSSTTTRSASAVTTRITCSTSTIVVPCARMPRMRSTAPSISAGVRPDSTSSSSRRRGLRRRARAPARGTCRWCRLRSPGQRVARAARPVNSSQCAAASRRVAPVERRAAPNIAGERDVVADRQVRERPRDLVGARDAGRAIRCAGSASRSTPPKRALPRVGAVMTADDVDQRRLARAVRTDQAEDLAFAHVEVDAVERAHALERLARRRAPPAAPAGRRPRRALRWRPAR